MIWPLSGFQLYGVYCTALFETVHAQDLQTLGSLGKKTKDIDSKGPNPKHYTKLYKP